MPDELIVLGSSSGAPTRRRFPPAYALITTSKLFLLDCGAPVSTLLYRYDLDPIDVRAVFLSHWHMDRVANLGLLLSQNHQRKRPRALNIYGPAGTRGKIRRLLSDSFLLPEELSYKLNITNIKSEGIYKESLLRVTFFKTQHLDQPKVKSDFGRKAMACGMVIKGPGWRIVYSGDVGAPKDLAPYVKGCDLLIHEMANQEPEAVAEFAAAARIPHVLINHLDLKYDESPKTIEKAFGRYYDGDLIIAEDGTRVQLSRIRKEPHLEIKPEYHDPYAAQSHRFLQVLLQDYNLASARSRDMLASAHRILVAPTVSNLVESGQVRVMVASLNSALMGDGDNADRVKVTLTIDAGQEDVETKARERAAGLRRGRILRIIEEALEQEGILTQADLARLLSVDQQAIRRDLQVLQTQNHEIFTFDRITHHGLGLSYKARAIELWLDQQDRHQISRWLHQSLQAVQRCIDEFLQVVALHDHETGSPEEIAILSRIPSRIASDYVTIYKAAMTIPSRMSRLNNEMTEPNSDHRTLPSTRIDEDTVDQETSQPSLN